MFREVKNIYKGEKTEISEKMGRGFAWHEDNLKDL
jgi:hypothetical protein